MWRTQPGRVASRCTRIYGLPWKNKVPSCEYLRLRRETLHSLELCDRPAFFRADNTHVASPCGGALRVPILAWKTAQFVESWFDTTINHFDVLSKYLTKLLRSIRRSREFLSTIFLTGRKWSLKIFGSNCAKNVIGIRNLCNNVFFYNIISELW